MMWKKMFLCFQSRTEWFFFFCCFCFPEVLVAFVVVFSWDRNWCHATLDVLHNRQIVGPPENHLTRTKIDLNQLEKKLLKIGLKIPMPKKIHKTVNLFLYEKSQQLGWRGYQKWVVMATLDVARKNKLHVKMCRRKIINSCWKPCLPQINATKYISPKSGERSCTRLRQPGCFWTFFYYSNGDLCI